MAKLLVDGEFFDSVNSDSIYEGDFEALLLSHADLLYPDFHLLPFKGLVQSEYGSGRPDLALVDKRYRCWWVVEVELSSHSLRNHVEVQVSVFSTAKYGAEAAAELCKDQRVEPAAISEMLKGSQPRVFVIVNQPRPDWVATLAKWNAIVGVAELFRSRRNRTILRINGSQPTVPVNELTRCRVDSLMQNFLKVDSPAALLHLQALPLIPITFEGSVAEWKFLRSSENVWLIPNGRYPLPPKQRVYKLVSDEQGNHYFVV